MIVLSSGESSALVPLCSICVSIHKTREMASRSILSGRWIPRRSMCVSVFKTR